MVLQDYMGANPGWAYLNGVCELRNQMANGFVKGDLLRYDGTTFIKALADTEANAEVIGMVIHTIDANQFVLLTQGATSVANQYLSGLTPGAVYYLSDTTPGAFTTVEPTIPGHISKPVMIAATAQGGWFFNMRGVVIPPLYSKAWDLPWGVVPGGYASSTTLNLTGVTAATDLPGLAVTFTAISGRLYKASFNCLLNSTTPTTRVQVGLRNESNVQISSAQRLVPISQQHSAEHSAIFRCGVDPNVPAGQHTWRLIGWQLTGTGTSSFFAATGDPAQLTIEDAGPDGGP
jgi:hypothetical protein